MSDTAESDRAGRSRRGANPDRLPIWWTGLTGVVGMLCCVGPDYAWWFRIGGLGVLALYPHLVERHEVSQPHVTTGLRHQRERRFLLQARCGVLHPFGAPLLAAENDRTLAVTPVGPSAKTEDQSTWLVCGVKHPSILTRRS